MNVSRNVSIILVLIGFLSMVMAIFQLVGNRLFWGTLSVIYALTFVTGGILGLRKRENKKGP